MIKFQNLSKDEPYIEFLSQYKKAKSLKQEFINATCISSYSKKSNEVDSRYVNLKFIDDKKFIFFSNFNSPKSKQFLEHEQITATIFWSKTNIQIRIKAIINKLNNDFSDAYFRKRSKEKNALSISSNQSQRISSYEEVKNSYKSTLAKKNLDIRPKYWGGFEFLPYYFEFWEGHKSRLNRRLAFKLEKDNWKSFFLQP